MDIIDNLRKIGKNWRLSALVIWLLIGIAVIPYPIPLVSVIGIMIFFPFLVYLMFLFLLSLISKKDIFEYPPWKIGLFLVISLPIMALISIILGVLFIISVISYFFFTSWFILYGCFLIGKRVDKQTFKVPKARPFLRTLIFFGGLAGSLLLLYLFIIGPTLFDFSSIMEEPVEIPWYLNGVYILVGAILIGLAITCIVFLFKKVIHGWFGVFALLVSVYTLFLILKIYLGIEAEPEEEKAIGSIWAYIAIILPDLFIIFYSLSTLMGSQAELLSQKFKRFGLDTVIIWLFLSKVTYEFIHYFPYDLFSNANTPWIQWLSNINNDLINLLKNIAVLAFFILLLIIIGIYEIRKYSLEQKELKEEVEAEVKELLAPQPTFEEPPPVGEKSEIMEVLETDILEDEGDHDETMEDVDTDIFKDEGDRDETMEDVDSDIFKDDSSHEEITEDVDTDTFNDEDIHKNNNEME